MSVAEQSMETRANPETVWRIWSDTSTWPTWNPDIAAIELNGPMRAGASGSMTTRSGGRHAIVIETVEPGRAFELVTAGPPLTRLIFRCQVLPSTTGSRISQGVRLRGPLAPLFAGMMAKRIAQTFPPVLRGLANQAEASAARG
jgi:uncharacterized protein YndB with AHSA1/START domain